MEKFDVTLIILHDKIDYVRCNLINLLGEINDLYPNDNESLPEYTRLLYLNYISLSELSYSIKEYYILKNILIHKF
jgi:hypothetical protein